MADWFGLQVKLAQLAVAGLAPQRKSDWRSFGCRLLLLKAHPGGTSQKIGIADRVAKITATRGYNCHSGVLVIWHYGDKENDV
jgi:hypothetical protein